MFAGIRSLLRRSLSYSRLYPQFKYMTFIFSQPFKLHLARKCFFKKKLKHAAYLQKCELYKTSYSLFHKRFSILQRVG